MTVKLYWMLKSEWQATQESEKGHPANFFVFWPKLRRPQRLRTFNLTNI